MVESQENSITILLGLKGYKVGTATEVEGSVVVEVEAGPQMSSCPRCGSVRRLLEKEVDADVLASIADEEEVFLGIDEHSFKRQELVHMVTEVKKRKVLVILKDDRIVTLKEFLTKIPVDKVKEVCIDMKESLRKLVEALYPRANLVADPFHVIADSNKRIDEARRIEQDVNQKRKVRSRRRYS